VGLPFIDPYQPRFPPPELALDEPNGLLAFGGNLGPETLLTAYRQGIFPWYSAGQPILWWSPDPRAVLVPGAIHVSRSLAKAIRRPGYHIRVDTVFATVVEACAAPRGHDSGTWILPEMISAYRRLHELGHAHSIEYWLNGELAGGLYGVAIGAVFCAESMFSRAPNASKIVLAHLSRGLAAGGFTLIDCQFETLHLQSMGAVTVSRRRYLEHLRAPAAHQWPATAISARIEPPIQDSDAVHDPRHHS